ncbi:hypothetical protein [Desulfoplanes formicivorans]|uniref:Uncharacterized protein n=1 Tax=Desulfoplanes formicivorans TaxID=1592317 RepID=A0A194AGV8_9BACT|nr:hypothetical protein [Desulfoplanes formicivorans]GAU08445.1 hypothetical protein DPF_1155 [Desulfoplanes formicivorans]
MEKTRDINARVKALLLDARTRETRKLPAEFDMVDMPLEGVAAYWLSLKKVLVEKKKPNLLATEAAHTREAYVRHLLELCTSSLDAASIRCFAAVKKKVILADLQRKFVLMAIAILGIADNENPQKVMVRFLSKFPISPVFEKQVFEVAQLIIANLENASFNHRKFLALNLRMKPEAMLIVLVVFCMLVRRKGAGGLDPFLQHVRCNYFNEGLTLIKDGFDKDFIKYRLNLQKREILEETELKMDMSVELALALIRQVTYDDMYLIARSYMLS